MLARPARCSDWKLDQAVKNYARAVDAGLLKIFSKMGISTLLSYRGAQVFEAIGLSRAVIDEYFPGTPSRIEGIGLEIIARESLQRVGAGVPARPRCRAAAARRRR